MNGVHDMGGMHGFGPIAPEADEPVFHEIWEARMFGLSCAMTYPPGFTIDRSRYLGETMPPVAYLTWSYYEHWYFATAQSLLEAGIVTMEELRTGRAAAGRPKRNDAMRELQPFFDKLLLIPGREITTFQGHINFLGSWDFIDFRLDGKTVRSMNQLLAAAKNRGAITSINHPMAAGGEICLGCRWTPRIPADMRLLTAVEAVNGGSEQHALSDLPYWNEKLNQGCRLTGIGGSDNHQPLRPLDQVGSVGRPTTVVYATDLSTPSILDGIRAGHVFIDLAGTRDRIIEVSARAGGRTAHSGDSLDAPRDDPVRFEAHVTAAAGGRVRWIEDGNEIASDSNTVIDAADKMIPLLWTSDGDRHWLRVEVAGPDGKLWLIANPIFINWTVSNNCSGGPG